eukprot:Em0242g6a
MLRYFQQVNRIVLTTLALLCGLCMSDDPVACTQLANMTCQAVQDASVEYSLNVSSTTYHESQLLSITISRNRCPNFEEYGGFTEDTPKKSWNYTITAISSSNQAPIGYFKVPSGSRLEIDSCNHSTVLLFSTCEASPVDLPRTYDWVAPPTTAGTICFKAVIQPPTGSCETIERCIAPLTSYTERPVDLEISGDGELGSGVAVESTVAAECNKKWNCSFQSNNRSKPLCGSDGVLYPNNCYRKHAECLKRTIIITKPARGSVSVSAHCATYCNFAQLSNVDYKPRPNVSGNEPEAEAVRATQ